jgi:hypothetical protein
MPLLKVLYRLQIFSGHIRSNYREPELESQCVSTYSADKVQMTTHEARVAQLQSTEHLLLSKDARVTCPKCDSTFSLEQGFARAALEQFAQRTEGTLSAVRKAERAEAEKQAERIVSQRDDTVRRENVELKKLLAEQGEKHAEALEEVRELAKRAHDGELHVLRTELAERQERLDNLARRESELATREQTIDVHIADAARAQAQTLVASDRDLFKNRLADKDRQLSELRSKELSLLREHQALKDHQGDLDNEVARKLSAGRAEIETRVRSQEREKSEFEKAELQKRLTGMQTQLAEAQRKGAQTSQQLQGEVLELTLQEDLEAAFPFDTIEEVRKGVRGGDVIQRVMTRAGQTAGVLLWEAKRAKDWSAQWIGKLKEDMRISGADVGVIVSVGVCFPKDWREGALFDIHEDVWVTSWTTAVQLATVLRTGLLDVHKQRLASAGKGEKMEAVYDYLTSPQFSNKLRAVYAGFHRMREELEAEKSQTMQRWARREKQLQSGVAALVGVAGDIQGLAQQDLPLLEIEAGLGADIEGDRQVEASQLGLNVDR